MSVEEITHVKKHLTRHVCVKGREPLQQKDAFILMQQLCNHNFIIFFETSGTISCADVDPIVKRIINIKTPSYSREEEKNIHGDNWPLPVGLSASCAEFFVIYIEKDCMWSEVICQKYRLFDDNIILYSPLLGVINEKWLADRMFSEKSKARLPLQTHKYIRSKDQGV